MESFVIKATTLFDGHTKREGDHYITVEGSRIVSVDTKPQKAAYEGVVTPAFIDAHSHIGMARQAEGEAGDETNDRWDQIMPLCDPLNSIYFDDPAFYNAARYGVLYSCVLPGSGNVLGGQAMLIRNFAPNRQAAFVRRCGYKMALGYNPRSTATRDWSGVRPNTRMGVYQHLEQTFDKLLIKLAQQDMEKARALRELEAQEGKDPLWKTAERDYITQKYDLAFDPSEQALLDILKGKEKVRMHVHKEDDVFYFLSLVKKYNLRAVAEHTGDVHHTEVFDALAAADISVVYGPVDAFAYKTELNHYSSKNIEKLIASKAFYALMTDSPVKTTQEILWASRYLLHYGLDEASALAAMTSRSARILGVEDRLGTVAPDKWASLIVWSGNPFYLGARPIAVFAEGAPVPL